MQKLLLQIITIFFTGATGIWKAIPVGFAIKAHPVTIAIFTALGSISMVLFLYYSGEKVKTWIVKKSNPKRIEKRKKRFTQLKEKYGPAGLGLIASGTLGPIPTMVISFIAIDVNQKFMKYMIIGIVFWTSIITLLSYYCIDIVLKFV